MSSTYYGNQAGDLADEAAEQQRALAWTDEYTRADAESFWDQLRFDAFAAGWMARNTASCENRQTTG